MILFPVSSNAQCLSSANPVGGTDNLLVLEKGSFRVISFYKYAQGNQYFENDQRSDFDLIKKAYYNYLSANLGYGISNRFTAELEIGYFINKTQIYNIEPSYKLTGKGFSNFVIAAKYNLYSNNPKRIYLSSALGIKIPSTRIPQTDNNIELPVEVQPTIGSYGFVIYSSFVKENSGKGLRYFITNRIDISHPNKNDYKLGTAIFSSIYMSKHLMFSWIKGDWTAILQLRNEIRWPDRISEKQKESSGGTLFYIVPQINYAIKEIWYVSAMVDIPVYQYFIGTQLGAGFGITATVSRTIDFKNINKDKHDN